MKKPDIVFLDAGSVDLGDVDLSPFKKIGNYIPYKTSSSSQIIKRVGTSPILISNKFILDDSVLKQLPQLKLICVAATGTNNVDLKSAKKRGIAVANVAGYSTSQVAEHTLLFLLALSHRLIPHHQASLEGLWSRSSHFALLDFPFADLRGKTLGIIGYGHIGRKVATLAKAFGMKIIVGKRGSLKDLFSTADYVTLHCPLSRETYHLVGTSYLSMMKKGSYLLNLSRGPVIVEKDVASALKKGLLAGFATDVLDKEPPPKNHPFFGKQIRDKILITPHVAWAALESRQKLMDEIAKNIGAFLKGKKRNRII